MGVSWRKKKKHQQHGGEEEEGSDTAKVVVLQHNNARVEVYTHGATVTSWKVNGEEVLFLR